MCATPPASFETAHMFCSRSEDGLILSLFCVIVLQIEFSHISDIITIVNR